VCLSGASLTREITAGQGEFRGLGSKEEFITLGKAQALATLPTFICGGFTCQQSWMQKETCLKANASNIKRSETCSNAHKTHMCSFHYAMSGNLSTEYKDTIMSGQRIAGEDRGGPVWAGVCTL